jgi:antirestriction protein ArdC
MSKRKGGVAAIYQLVTDRIVAMLEQNVVPWRLPWNQIQAPANLISRTPYRGINALITSMLGYRSPYFLSYRQMVEAGGTLKDDAKGNSVPILYWNWREVEDKKTGEAKNIPFLRYYRVFNVEHIEGLKFSEKELYPQLSLREGQAIESCERLIQSMPNRPTFKIGSSASYNPTTDVLTMPDANSFDQDEEFYSTLFHELAHSTGHNSRLNRSTVMDRRPGDKPSYAMEELIAELGSAFLCAQAGITETVIQNQAAYIKGWLRALKNDPKLLIQAAGKAQKAADYIQNIQFGESEDVGTEIVEEAEHAVVVNDQPTMVPALVEDANVEASESIVPTQGSLFPVEPVNESPKRKRRMASKVKPQKPAKKESLVDKATKLLTGSKAKKVVRK